ncbi:MAG TPA: HD domain-containing phosphohydrolase [Chthonomonadales bacterium]|nr:HD domain-containing phosphohydrolase [Chthonomonadales bacterium]
MHQRCHTRHLRVGMYVILPLKWWEHPFARNQFLISSEDLLQRVRDCIDGDVLVDPDRCEMPADGQPASASPAPADASAEAECCAERLHDVVHDTKLPPARKAHAIRQHSRVLMKSVLEEPTAPSIGAAKKAIGAIADLIVADRATAFSLLSVSAHDFQTYAHSVSVGLYGVSLASQVYEGGSGHNLRELGAAFFLHDLGKTRVPTEIIRKPGRLDNNELAIMRTHPEHSYDILCETATATEECRIIALQHHERSAGGGYPLGLEGDSIHEYARICSIADVFDALVARRPYKRPLTPFEALSMMRDRMMGHFSRPLFEGFVRMFASQRKAA